MAKNIKLIFLIFILITTLLFFNNKVVKSETLGGLDKTAGEIGYQPQPAGNAASIIDMRIGTIINIVISLLGVIFIVIIWLGGLDIVGANGNEEIIKKGKERIINGAIGILVVLIAYLFTKAILMVVGGTGQFNI